MRSVKRPQRPVHRYKALLSPGIAVLAVLLFCAAFMPPKSPRGETARFEADGLCLEIAGVRRVEEGEAYDTYYVSPGGTLTVLEASVGRDGAPRWELRSREGEALELAEGTAPVSLGEGFAFADVRGLGTGDTLLSLRVAVGD